MKANLANAQALKSLIDVQRRGGLSLNDYFSLTSTVYPELLTVDKEEHCSPASTASDERSLCSGLLYAS